MLGVCGPEGLCGNDARYLLTPRVRAAQYAQQAIAQQVAEQQAQAAAAAEHAQRAVYQQAAAAAAFAQAQATVQVNIIPET